VRQKALQGKQHISAFTSGGIKRIYSELDVRPKDKKENYVKRCVAIAGDKIEIKNAQIYIDDVAQTEYKKLQHNYTVIGKPNTFTQNKRLRLKEELDINLLNYGRDSNSQTGQYSFTLTADQAVALEAKSYVESVSLNIDSVPSKPYGVRSNNRPVFPHSRNFAWTKDNFGPMTVPAAGTTVELTVGNLPLYERIIRDYEENTLHVSNGQIYINGEISSQYTFKMNYYWLMGDNRHNSLDSRYWGFVPEDHVVGRPSFVWLSLDRELDWGDGKIRWSRMFKGVE